MARDEELAAESWCARHSWTVVAPLDGSTAGGGFSLELEAMPGALSFLTSGAGAVVPGEQMKRQWRVLNGDPGDAAGVRLGAGVAGVSSWPPLQTAGDARWC